MICLIDGGFTNKEKTCTEPKFIPVITLFLFFLIWYYFFPLFVLRVVRKKKKKTWKVFWEKDVPRCFYVWHDETSPVKMITGKHKALQSSCRMRAWPLGQKNTICHHQDFVPEQFLACPRKVIFRQEFLVSSIPINMVF